jgi:hypothetical protein
MTPTLPAVTASRPSSAQGTTVTLGDVVWGLAIRGCPDSSGAEDCPYCSGPETD